MTQKDVNFKVKTLLEDLEKDVKANAEDPELMQHASWMRRPETLVDSCASIPWMFLRFLVMSSSLQDPSSLASGTFYICSSLVLIDCILDFKSHESRHEG